MKNLVLVGISVFTMSAYSAPESKPVVSAQQKFNVVSIVGYNEVYQDFQDKVDSEYLYLGMYDNLNKETEIQAEINFLKKCHESSNAKSVNSLQVAQLIRNNVETMSNHLKSYEVEQKELKKLVNDFEKLTTDFENLFEGSKLSVCEEESVPAYSDGQRDTVIRLNDRVLMILRLARPD